MFGVKSTVLFDFTRKGDVTGEKKGTASCGGERKDY